MSDTRLVPCSSCRRHIAAGEACPFCGAAAAPPTGGYGYPTEGKAGEQPNAMATLYGLPPVTNDRVPAPHYGMPPPMTPEQLQEMGRMTAPRYGMPPLSPAHPTGLLKMLVILAIVAVLFLMYVKHVKA